MHIHRPRFGFQQHSHGRMQLTLTALEMHCRKLRAWIIGRRKPSQTGYSRVWTYNACRSVHIFLFNSTHNRPFTVLVHSKQWQIQRGRNGSPYRYKKIDNNYPFFCRLQSLPGYGKANSCGMAVSRLGTRELLCEALVPFSNSNSTGGTQQILIKRFRPKKVVRYVCFENGICSWQLGFPSEICA